MYVYFSTKVRLLDTTQFKIKTHVYNSMQSSLLT